MIHFDQLTYTYPSASRPALDCLTLDIAEGEFVLITGPSGAGKSTLLRCLNGLVPHFTGGSLSGSITVAEHDPVAEGPQALCQTVGFVFQDPEAQFVMDRVEDEIAFALENAAIPPAEMRLRVEEALHLLDLAPLRDRPLETLSGGEKQRVAIGAALAFRPRILALDEPTSQLDPESAEDVLQALRRLNQDLGLTTVLVEHRLERVLPHADRLVYLPSFDKSKQQVLSGPPRQVLHQIDMTPPLVTLSKALGWDPLPLSIKEGRRFAGAYIAQRQARPSSPAPQAASRRISSQPPILQVKGVCFAYDGATALDGVSLTVGAGNLVVLMGRNGSGKTTLLKCITGLLRPQRGEILLEGKTIAGRGTADICRNVGYLPQDPDALLFADTVAEELQVTLRNQGLEDSPPIVPSDLLAYLGLAGLASSYPRDLSVGQRQRVALGAVTITRPNLLLLDEPTRGMDYQAKQEIVRLLREWQAAGMAVLMVTHDVELAVQAADRVVLLSQGQVIADDTPSVLTASPLFAPQVAQLFPGTEWLTVDDVLKD